MPASLADRTTPGGSSTEDRITRQLTARIGPHKYDMWFGHTRLRVEDGRLEVATDSPFVARWIDTHFAADLRHAAAGALGDEPEIRVSVRPDLFPGRRAGEDDGDAAPRPPTPVERRPPRRPSEARAAFRSLDDFVVGASNRLAYSAARRLVEDPEAAMTSPLFLHGECGVGKTHLLQGICRRFEELTGRAAAMRYVTGEQFTNDYITAIRTNTLDRFRGRLRQLDLLAIDDVHFLSNKVRTQSEFLHTLDAIDLTGARIVLASDGHPRQIKRFSQALISRFLSGMVVRIDRPDHETRTELVRRVAAVRGLRLSPEAVDRVASRCLGSVRELEGAVTKLAAVHALTRPGEDAAEVGPGLVEQVLSERAWQPSVPIRIGQVIDAVCGRLCIAPADLMGNGRHRRVVLARALVAYLGRELTTHSFPEIAQAIGRTFHSTVHTAAQRLRRQLDEDQRLVLGGGEQAVRLRNLVDELRHDITRGDARA